MQQNMLIIAQGNDSFVGTQALEARALQSLERQREQARNMQGGSLNPLLGTAARRAPPMAKALLPARKPQPAKRV